MFANNPHISSYVLYYGDVNPVETDVALGCSGSNDKIKAVFPADAKIFSSNSGPLGVKPTVDTAGMGEVMLCVLILHISFQFCCFLLLSTAFLPFVASLWDPVRVGPSHHYMLPSRLTLYFYSWWRPGRCWGKRAGRRSLHIIHVSSTTARDPQDSSARKSTCHQA